MPGPKMGPRPPDFNEEHIRHSPTFLKWASLEPGQKLKYACREFIKGRGDDEERLMRRIMIARRNNIRDHETLKKARRTSKRRPPTVLCDHEVEKEIDNPAVEATRSYKAWSKLPDGAEFVYNQKYIRGHEGHDWLLRKNIWRRMRYRRENKKMLERLKDAPPEDASTACSTAAAAAASNMTADQVAVEAAVAAAVSFGQTQSAAVAALPVQNPIEAAAARAALDAAAQLAAVTGLEQQQQQQQSSGGGGGDADEPLISNDVSSQIEHV